MQKLILPLEEKEGMNKITLAIDALTQFRAGVEKVKIGNRIISAEQTFNVSRMSLFDDLDDEARIIVPLMMLIETHFSPEQIENLSVEVVA